MMRKTLSLTYSKMGNDAQIYEVRNKIHSTKQREMSASFFELYGLWKELDYYRHFQANCTGSAVKFQKLLEKKCIYDFLVGLDVEYDPSRVQVLGKDSFPSLKQAHYYIQYKESRRGVILYNAPLEKAGMMVNSEPPKATTSKKDHLHCDYMRSQGIPKRFVENCMGALLSVVEEN